MVDRSSRDLAVQLLTDWVDGKISNFQMEDRWPNSDSDGSISGIAELVWTFYDDYPESRLSEEDLSDAEVIVVERCRQFLSSDLEYRWPDFSYNTGSVSIWRRLLPGGRRLVADRIKDFESGDDFTVWPFRSDQLSQFSGKIIESQICDNTETDQR